mmetsp:Transcript_65644/g.172006  ORF Transcript_65644/g.172006 Transcript_65644/m.172006 type:complete len:489 (+) Transcript_65644:75-1541(+)
MRQGLAGAEPGLRVDGQHPREEVQEDLVVGAHALPERGPLGQQQLDAPLRLRRAARLRGLRGVPGRGARVPEEPPVLAEVLRDEPARSHHVPRDGADDPHHPSEKALHRVVLEEHVAGPQLCEHAAQGPDVHLAAVGESQQHLGRAVGTRLHVGGEPVVDKARGAKVDELHLAPGIRLDEHVLRLQVSVDQPQAVDVLQRPEQLPSDPLQMPQGEIRLLALLAVELGELVQVVAQELRDDDEVLLVVEVVDETQAVLLVHILRVGVDKLQQLDLVKGLVYVVLVVLDDLHADHLAGLEVQALHRPREGRRAQVVQNLVARCDDGVHHDRELLGVLEARPVPLVDHTQREGVEDDAVPLGGVEGVARRRVAVHRGLLAAPHLALAREHARHHALHVHNGLGLGLALGCGGRCPAGRLCGGSRGSRASCVGVGGLVHCGNCGNRLHSCLRVARTCRDSLRRHGPVHRGAGLSLCDEVPVLLLQLHDQLRL